jgi:hypothetical protein
LRKTALTASSAAVLAACAHITPRDNPPDLTFSTAASLDQAAACLVRQFDAMVPGYAHFAATIVPGKTYEVRPGKELVMTGEVYYARVNAAPGGGSQVEVYALSTWAAKVGKYAEACRS